MSKFFSCEFSSLEPYTPGEQPKNQKYIKLNTNESPFAPSENVSEAAFEAAKTLRLYSDPTCGKLHKKLAEVLGVCENEVITGNGSDEILNFCFMAFCNRKNGCAFPEISYGFYPVFAQLNKIPADKIALREDFSINPDDYCGIGKTVIIANPNAPTGLALSVCEIEKILKSNPQNVVVVDEAYVDFGAQSVLPLIKKYDNLVVVGTFSKSRSLAGARLGFAAANSELINDLNTIKYSTNPYNVNSMTAACAVAALESNGYYMENCRKIIENRAYTKSKLEQLGFFVLDSKANFLFARCNQIGGEDYYSKLRQKGVLVRHFDSEKIKDFVRVTIGTKEQMETFIEKTKEILKGE